MASAHREKKIIYSTSSVISFLPIEVLDEYFLLIL